MYQVFDPDMAKNNKTLFKNHYFRIFAILLALCALIVLGFFSFRYVFETMFSDNPKFRLRNVVVQSSGYWNNRSDDVMRILQLKKGVTNLFATDLYELRKDLESRKGEGIAFAEVSKELPDTIKIDIVERIPQAVLYNRKSGMVVDKEGVVMDSAYFTGVVDSLPVITGFKIEDNNSKGKSEPYGEMLKNLKPALVFISMINQDFSDMEVRVVNLYSQNKLLVFMPVIDNRVIKVILPFEYSVDAPSSSELADSTKILRAKLEELRELLKYLKWKKAQFTEINMIYKDQAVVK